MKDDERKEQMSLFPSLIESYRDGKDEMNIVEFPVAVIARATKPGQLTLSFGDTIRDQSTGELMDRKVTVHGSETYGLPAAQDDEVLLGLVQICRMQGWPQTVRFTRYQLVSLMGWAFGGASYKRLYTALHRLATTTYDYKYAWRDRTEKEWVPSRVFSYIQKLEIHETGSPTSSGMCTVQWASWFHESLSSGNIKSLDYDFYRGLKNSLAKRIYRFLDKRFHNRPNYDADLRVFAEEKMGLARSYKDIAQVKRVMLKAIIELEAAGFLVPMDPKSRFIKISAGVWRVRFEQGRVVAHEPKIKETEVVDMVVTRLETLGVSGKRAKDLAKDHKKDFIEQKIEILEFLLSSNANESPRDPGAWLATAIERDYKAPKGFKTRAERLSKAEEAKRRREVKKATLEARKTEEEARKAQEVKEEEEESIRVQDYLDNLEEAQRTELEEKSLETIERSWRDRDGVMAKMMRDNALRELVLSRIEEEIG